MHSIAPTLFGCLEYIKFRNCFEHPTPAQRMRDTFEVNAVEE
jgi:hypothetical protein